MEASTNIQMNGGPGGWIRRVALVVLFAVAFGFLEAAVVVYLRAIYDPIRASLYPGEPSGSLVPLITFEQLREAGPVHVRRLRIELGRELATMIMLAAVASLAMRRRGEWVAMFMISFGVWDIAFYGGLKAMINFPTSLLTWDILFLIPVPWVGPVLAPLIVSLSMIGAGLVLVAGAGHGRSFRVTWLHWVVIVVGGVIIILSFCWEHSRIMAGQPPGPFNWYLFSSGEGIGLMAFAHAWSQRRRQIDGTNPNRS